VAEPVRKPLGEPPPASGHESSKSAFREYFEAIVIAFVLAIVLRTFFIQAYKIPSGSMIPTLLVGDHLIVDKLAYGFRLPDSFFGVTPLAGEIPYGKYLLKLGHVHRGDVCVFVFPEDRSKDFIKRVVAIPGDTVEVKAGMLYVNGNLAPDKYAQFEVPQADRAQSSPRDYFGPLKLPAGEFFMMGDNRDRSYDSRFWGPVSRDAIEGRAMFIYWSWKCADSGDGDPECSWGVHWNRLFHVIR
jgi:signal peptidase I